MKNQLYKVVIKISTITHSAKYRLIIVIDKILENRDTTFCQYHTPPSYQLFRAIGRADVTFFVHILTLAKEEHSLCLTKLRLT